MSHPIPQQVEEKLTEIISNCVDCVYGMNIDTSMKEAKRLYSELENSPLLKKQIRQALLSVYNSGREDKEVVERVAKAIYDQMSYYEDGAKPAWVESGNSLKQDEARRLAITALSAPKPSKL